MALSPRPRVLTILAVLNFVSAWPRFIAGLDRFVAPAQPGSVLTTEYLTTVYPSLFLQRAAGLLSLVAVVLMIATGIGYLRQSERLGRQLGSGLAGLSIVMTLLAPWLWQSSGSGVVATVGLTLLYQLGTLYILNVSHRAAFSNQQ